MLDKLEAIKERFEEVSQLLIQPDAMEDLKRFKTLNKEYKDLEKIRKYFEKSDPVISFKLGSVPAEVSSSNGLEKIKSK